MSGETTLNNFDVDLKYSLATNDDMEINDSYFRIFCDLKKVDLVNDPLLQKQGIDKILIFKNGKEVWIDEKKRRKDYGDILLEEYSDFDQKKVGWLSKEKKTDYIAYVIWKPRKLYLLPFKLLQLAWRENYKEWLKHYGRKFAQNKGYRTSNIPVPAETLLSAIKDQIKQELI